MYLKLFQCSNEITMVTSLSNFEQYYHAFQLNKLFNREKLIIMNRYIGICNKFVNFSHVGYRFPVKEFISYLHAIKLDFNFDLAIRKNKSK